MQLDVADVFQRQAKKHPRFERRGSDLHTAGASKRGAVVMLGDRPRSEGLEDQPARVAPGLV